MRQSEWFVYIMAVDRTKMGNLGKYIKFKGKFRLFTSDGTNIAYDALGLVLYKIFKMHNEFFVG